MQNLTSKKYFDHAWCEQKAAANALYIITNNSEHIDLVEKMAEIAIEEMDHFKQVVEITKQRGYTLGREKRDDYVNQPLSLVKKIAAVILHL